MTIPPSGIGSATVTIIARIHDEAQLRADGVDAGAINGFAIDNQATVFSGAQQIRTVDPNGRPDAPNGVTRFILSSQTDIAGGQTLKRVQDVNGGPLEPGDTLRFTVQINNTGSQNARVLVDDTFPVFWTGAVWKTVSATLPVMESRG